VEGLCWQKRRDNGATPAVAPIGGFMNKQLREHQMVGSGGHLEVHSIFATIQGEGPFSGRAAVFVRLAGCNLQCPACDTDYTSKRFLYSPEHLLRLVEIKAQGLALHNPLIVITGGEPFRQNLFHFVKLAIGKWHTVQIETNGTLGPLDSGFASLCSLDTTLKARCFIVCSPKTGKINAELLPLICCFKYVVTDGQVADDGLPTKVLGHSAVPMVARPPEGFSGVVYVQPADLKDEKKNRQNLRHAKFSATKGHTLQLQIHKIIGVE
jgi:7-carboxy-7-deazaguanine synthase